MAGLYIHIPFCATKCPYCDFYSLPARPADMDAYHTVLLHEIARAPGGVAAESVYFGGGTPVLFGSARLSALLAALRNQFTLAPDCEITLEANPFSLPLREYEALRAAGFNRISFGMQSADPEELKTLGRRQSPAMVQSAVSSAKAAGFENLSVDLMLGIPGQTPESLCRSIAFLNALEIQHISAYLLKIEPGTPYAKTNMAEACPDEDTVCDLYLLAVEQLARAGFRQYEISNFARPGFESRHNLKYWRREEYLGFGPAAHSFYQGGRYAHPRDLAGYLSSDGTNATLTDSCENPAVEELMLRLRLSEGVDLAALSINSAARQAVLAAARPLEQAGLLAVNQTRIALTPRGFLVSNAIILRLTDAMEQAQA
ncbi:MAG: radical SAM family heme chaperone HemW [Oscillospiraceae bacterium]|jgi:oxygen-independent coproporphyrinogen-3 oxidase